MTPQLTFLCEARFQVSPPVELGRSSDGVYRMIPITGGTVSGPGITGTVLPGGADWQRVRPDGTAEIEARYVIQTHDGAAISVLNKGLRGGPPEVMRRLAAGEPVDPGEYYFRTAPQFQTGDNRYAWLTQRLFVGLGERAPGAVIIRFWALD